MVKVYLAKHSETIESLFVSYIATLIFKSLVVYVFQIDESSTDEYSSVKRDT